MKTFILTLLFGAIILVFVWKLDFASLNSWLSGASTPGHTRFTQGPPILSVAKLSDLVSLKVRIKTILDGENNWYKGIWEVEGDACFGIDCNQAEWLYIDADARSLTLSLPEPMVTTCRVDHEHTRLYDFRSRSWNPARLIWGNPDELRDEAMKRAQAKLSEEAQQNDYLTLAKDQTEYNLGRFYVPLGYKLTVEWQQGRASPQPHVALGGNGSPLPPR